MTLWHRMPAVRRRVTVNLVGSETALSGVLWQGRGPWLVLRQAALLEGHAAPVTADGEVVVERARVLFLQVL